MKVALIRPPNQKGGYISQESFIPPLGIGYLASFLCAQGVHTILMDGVIESLTINDTIHRIVKENVGIVGISAMTPEIQTAQSIAVAIKSRDQDIRTVIGGVHAIALPVETMHECPAFDFLVTGEGEFSMWELHQRLCDGISPENIHGVVWRRNAEILVNQSRPWIEDLDQLPFPSWNLYTKTFPCYFVLSSRGCPFRCNFCMRTLGDRVRYRTPENVVDEIEWLVKEFHPKRLIFQDETFTLNRKRTETLLDLMIAKEIPRKIEWVVQTRVDMIDTPLLRSLKRAGCYRIEFGIESGHPEILKGTKKGIDLVEAKKAVNTAKKEGLFVSCSFIFGHPNETKETIRETIRFGQKLNPDNVTYGIMVPYPKTEIASYVEKREKGYIQGPESWQDFTRFSKNGVALESVGHRDMERFQIEAYVRYFLFNVHLISFVKYMYNHRGQVVSFLKKFIEGRLLNRYKGDPPLIPK